MNACEEQHLLRPCETESDDRAEDDEKR